MFYISPATKDDVDAIRNIAEKTWWPTYSGFLSKDQIRYMLDTLYSPEALHQAMADGSQSYIILHDENGAGGFASFGQRTDDPDIYKLYKLYVLPEYHGKEYGKMLLQEVKRQLIRKNILTLDLNVNRFNPARAFYEKMGFKVLREEDIPIGPYWMNDFVMRLRLD